MTFEPHISVVVPTYRRDVMLRRCLEALLVQRCGAPYEIVVADNAESSATEQLVMEMAANGPACLRYVKAGRGKGPAAARNDGWRAARAQTIAFTDDDCIPDRDWLAAGARRLSQGADGVWGRIVVPVPEEPTDYQRDAAGLETAEFVSANCFYRRELLSSVTGFDERFQQAWREDSDLYFTLMKKGCRLVHEPAAIVLHPPRRAAWGISLRQQQKSLYNALLYKKHPEQYRLRIQPRPPLEYYLASAAGVSAIGAGLLGKRKTATAALGVYLGVTVRFCTRRLRFTSRSPRHVMEMAVTSALIPPLSVFWRLWGAAKFRVLFF
jgi:glycosyltransferase involved in cell wall biosynthesis